MRGIFPLSGLSGDSWNQTGAGGNPFEDSPRPQKQAPTRPSQAQISGPSVGAAQAVGGLIFLGSMAGKATQANLVNDTGITATTTSENATPAQFKEISQGGSYSWNTLKTLAAAAGKIKSDGSAQSQAFEQQVKTSLLRSQDSALTAGERYLAAKDLSELFIDKFADAKAQIGGGINQLASNANKLLSAPSEVKAAVVDAKNAVAGAAGAVGSIVHDLAQSVNNALDLKAQLPKAEAATIAAVTKAISGSHNFVVEPLVKAVAVAKIHGVFDALKKTPQEFQHEKQTAAQTKRQNSERLQLQQTAQKLGVTFNGTESSAELRTAIAQRRKELVQNARKSRQDRIKANAEYKAEIEAKKAQQAFDALATKNFNAMRKTPSGKAMSFDQLWEHAAATTWGDLASTGVFNQNDATAQALLDRPPPPKVAAWQQSLDAWSEGKLLEQQASIAAGVLPQLATPSSGQGYDPFWFSLLTPMNPTPLLPEQQTQQPTTPNNIVPIQQTAPPVFEIPINQFGSDAVGSIDFSGGFGLTGLGGVRRGRNIGLERRARELTKKRSKTYARSGWTQKFSPSGVSYWVPPAGVAEDHAVTTLTVPTFDFSNVNAYLDPETANINTLSGLDCCGCGIGCAECGDPACSGMSGLGLFDFEFWIIPAIGLLALLAPKK